MPAASPPHGVFVPVPTFFVAKQAPSYNSANPPLDLETQLQHALFLARSGIKGLVLLGSTGEAVHVTRPERKALVSAVRKGLDNNGFPEYPLMAGTTTNSIPETLELLSESAEAGAQWGLVLAPGYYASIGASQEGLIEWYTAVADQSPIPILVYHYPAVSNNLVIEVSTFRILAAHPNIVGAKFSHGDLSLHTRVSLDPEIDRSRFAVYTGLGQHLFPAVQVGGAGAIDGLASFFPAQLTRLYELSSAEATGQETREKARRLQYLVACGEELVVKFGTVGIKDAVARLRGFGDFDGTRFPMKGGIPGGDVEWEKWKPLWDQLEEWKD